MSTLVQIVRNKCGATVDEASDARIIEALEEASVRIDNQPVEWLTAPNGAYTRIGRVAIGKYLVEATGATGSVDEIVLHDSSGDAIATLEATQAGEVTITDPDDPLPTAYATGLGYDVHAAAALIVDDLILQARDSYDFKRGDQSFQRSQRIQTLQQILQRLRARSIPRRRGETIMRDQQAGGV